MKLFARFLCVVIVGLPGVVSAQSITWGSAVGEELRDHANEKLTKTWRFELGVFMPGFYPTEKNIDQWVSNWVPLDSAKYNDRVGYFSSRAPAPEPQAAGLQAYIWIFNHHMYNSESEWLLLTDRDGNHSNDWMVPNRSTDPAAAVVDWRVSRATTVLMGNAQRIPSSSTKADGKTLSRVAYNTRPIPNTALLAAASKTKTENEPTVTLAGDLTEDFTPEE